MCSFNVFVNGENCRGSTMINNTIRQKDNSSLGFAVIAALEGLESAMPVEAKDFDLNWHPAPIESSHPMIVGAFGEFVGRPIADRPCHSSSRRIHCGFAGVAPRDGLGFLLHRAACSI